MGLLDDAAEAVSNATGVPVPAPPDPVQVAHEAARNPGPAATGALVGGALAGPAGATIGAALGLGQTERDLADKAHEAYVQGLNKAIADVKAAKPDYAALGPYWVQLNREAFTEAYKLRYGPACPPPDMLSPLVEIDVKRRRESLSEQQYYAELDNIHNASVEASVSQLEHERDNPEKQEEPTSGNERFNKFFSDVANAILHFVADRFQSNFEGAANESGLGAKILRGGLGISFEDIKARGLLGGDNSYLRRIIPTWSDNGGVFGGENSFFRKPFG